jgi:hypothetical protein
LICHVADTAGVNASLARKAHQNATIDRRAADRGAFDVGSGLQELLKHRHRFGYIEEKTKPRPEYEYDDRRPRHAGSGWGQYPVPGRYRVSAIGQRKSRIKLDVAAAG